MEQLFVIRLSVRLARAMHLSARSVLPMPPMKHISPRIQVGYVSHIPWFLNVWMLIRLMELRVVIHHSVRLARMMHLSARSVLSMPPMKYISPLIPFGECFKKPWFFRCVDGYSDDGTPGYDKSLSPFCSIDASWALSKLPDPSLAGLSR